MPLATFHDRFSTLCVETLKSSGLSAWGFVPREAFLAACAPLPPAVREKFGVDMARGVVAAALAYGEGPREPPAWAAAYGGPLLGLARFARADWYAELAARLRTSAASLRSRMRAEGLDPGPARAWRYLANSGLPEKELALRAGLGHLGRNGLVLVGGGKARGGPGAAVVLGLLLLPYALVGEATYPAGQRPEPAAFKPGGLCGSCRACVEACPTGALGEGGAFIRELCIQHWTARAGALPPAVERAWGARLYGCEACLAACPHFHPDPHAQTDRGRLGPGLPADFFLEAEDEEIRARLRGSALGLGWMEIEAFRRSARLATALIDSSS